MQAGRIDGQMNGGLPVMGVLDGSDGADRCAMQLDLGAGVHHQTRAIGNHGHRHGFGETAPELSHGKADESGDDHDGRQACQWACIGATRSCRGGTGRHRTRGPHPCRCCRETSGHLRAHVFISSHIAVLITDIQIANKV